MTSTREETMNANPQTTSNSTLRNVLAALLAASLSSNATSFSNQLVLVTNSIVVTNIFQFPPDSPLQPSAHRLVICSDRVRTLYHSGFNLPVGGGLLAIT